MALELALRLNALSADALVEDASVHDLSVAQALPFLRFDALWAILAAQPALVPPDATASEFVSELVDFQSRLLRTDAPSDLVAQLHVDVHKSTTLARLFTDISVKPIQQPRGAIQLVDRYDSLTDSPKLADRMSAPQSELMPQTPSSGRASLAGRASCRSRSMELSPRSTNRRARSCASGRTSGSTSRSPAVRWSPV